MKTNESKIHRILVHTGSFLLVLAATALILHFSWNMVMPELFGAGKMNGKHAVGLILLLSTVGTLVGSSVKTPLFHKRMHADSE